MSAGRARGAGYQRWYPDLAEWEWTYRAADDEDGPEEGGAAVPDPRRPALPALAAALKPPLADVA